jgi:Sec-independent protein translocase protein TatA
MDFNFLGIGLWELGLIFVLLFTVAGPKRMVKWAFELGRYAAQLRKMFQETMDAFKREIDLSDLDIRKDMPALPTQRFDIVKEANKLVNETKTEAKAPAAGPAAATTSNGAGSSTNAVSTNAVSTTADPTPPPTQKSSDEGSRYDAWVQN